MLKGFFFAAIIAMCGGFLHACSASADNTVYGPPDAGKPAADYCVRDLDCAHDGAITQACGFSIADGCSARGVCVDIVAGAGKCQLPDYCGCDGALVTTCPLVDPSYVRGGPTNGMKPTPLADGGFTCTQ